MKLASEYEIEGFPTLIVLNPEWKRVANFFGYIEGYDPNDGKILWTCDGLDKLVYTSPVVGDGVILTMGGFHGPAMGLKPGGSGNITESNRLWRETKNIPQRIGTGHRVIVDFGDAGLIHRRRRIEFARDDLAAEAIGRFEDGDAAEIAEFALQIPGAHQPAGAAAYDCEIKHFRSVVSGCPHHQDHRSKSP